MQTDGSWDLTLRLKGLIVRVNYLMIMLTDLMFIHSDNFNHSIQLEVNLNNYSVWLLTALLYEWQKVFVL